jgi:hypothetical protein
MNIYICELDILFLLHISLSNLSENSLILTRERIQPFSQTFYVENKHEPRKNIIHYIKKLKQFNVYCLRFCSSIKSIRVAIHIIFYRLFRPFEVS